MKLFSVCAESQHSRGEWGQEHLLSGYQASAGAGVGDLAGPRLKQERNVTPAPPTASLPPPWWVLGGQMNTHTTDLGGGWMKRQARNRLSVWGVSWDLPLPASQGSSILFTKYSAHIETRTVWLHVKGDGKGLSRVDFEVLEVSLPGDFTPVSCQEPSLSAQPIPWAPGKTSKVISCSLSLDGHLHRHL